MAGIECVQGHKVQIHERGGGRKLFTLNDLTQVAYTRPRSATGDSTVVLQGRSCLAQGETIDKVAKGAKRFEMVVFRGEERAFEGPIEQVETGRDSAIIIAKDVTQYLNGTPLSVDWPIETGEQKDSLDPTSPWLMTERARTIIEYELQTSYQARIRTGGAATVVTIPRWEEVTPPIDVLLHLDIRRSDTLYTRSDTLAFQMQLGEHLDNLADSGLDYAVIGRRIVIWDSAEPLGVTRRLTDADFDGELTVIAAGSEHASVAHVSAERPEDSTSPGPGVIPGVGNAGGEDSFTGVWTWIASLTQEEGSDQPTQDALNSQASRMLSGVAPVPNTIKVPDGATLKLGHGLGINDLIPGSIMPVTTSLNIRKVSQDQRLEKVAVTETAQGETIAITLTSAGDISAVIA
ncbi:MAG TPA: hypothetical protein VIT65_19650 [Microlunatus sp.]